MASASPLKSGISTSMFTPGEVFLISLTVRAKMRALSRFLSSLFTEVTTTWETRASLSRSRATASATREGSSRSSGPPLPVFTWQNPQLLVHTSPRIMKVRVPAPQHSPMLGHLASSQTVWRPSSRTSPRSLE